jgi:hypothetical protein
MKLHMKSGSGAALFALLAALGILPQAARAQATAEPPDSARLVQFATAYMAISEAREEFDGQIARVHDEEGRLRAREEVDAKIQEILETNEMTQEEYDEFILRISFDAEVRAAFEEVVARLEEGPS